MHYNSKELVGLLLRTLVAFQYVGKYAIHIYRYSYDAVAATIEYTCSGVRLELYDSIAWCGESIYSSYINVYGKIHDLYVFAKSDTHTASLLLSIGSIDRTFL